MSPWGWNCVCGGVCCFYCRDSSPELPLLAEDLLSVPCSLQQILVSGTSSGAGEIKVNRSLTSRSRQSSGATDKGE